MRCVPELDVRRGIEPEDSLPGDLPAFGSIGSELLDFRFPRSDYLMASHTKGDAGNSGVGSLSYPGVATGALQIMLEMNLVIEGDRLDRRGLQE